jgi:hypothetical protein
MDTVGLHGLYTQEANKEANDIINSKKNYVDINGEMNRITDNKEPVITLFNMTK